jgi:hypothetical protein
MEPERADSSVSGNKTLKGKTPGTLGPEKWIPRAVEE